MMDEDLFHAAVSERIDAEEADRRLIDCQSCLSLLRDRLDPPPGIEEVAIWVAEHKLRAFERDYRTRPPQWVWAEGQAYGLSDDAPSSALSFLAHRRFVREEVEHFDPSDPEAMKDTPRFDPLQPLYHLNPSGRYLTHKQALAFLTECCDADAETASRALREESRNMERNMAGVRVFLLAYDFLHISFPPDTDDDDFAARAIFPEADILALAHLQFGVTVDRWDAATRSGRSTKTASAKSRPESKPKPGPKPKNIEAVEYAERLIAEGMQQTQAVMEAAERFGANKDSIDRAIRRRRQR